MASRDPDALEAPPAVGVRGGAPYFSGLGWSGADAKKRKVEK